MPVNTESTITLALQNRIDQLQEQLRAALEQNEKLDLAVAKATSRVADLERDLERERAVRQAIENTANNNSIVQTMERLVTRHAEEMQRVVAQHAEEMQNERRRADAATIRHEQAILDLVGHHRQEVAERLDMVLDQNKALFKRISTAIQDLWTTRGTTRPSLDKEHWFLLARDDADASEDPSIVTFRIHSGQKAYIDKIGREKDVVVANPAANGIDIRQTAKKRMRELVGDEEDFAISALRFSCSNPDKLDGFLALLFESIDVALSPPSTDAFDSLQKETSKNLRDAFNLDNLFVGAAVAA